jgi:8-oxo-dGTP pyrophosphatase MutT (NUDIX family)
LTDERAPLRVVAGAPRPRQAGRAILRDRDGRVLLIHFVLPNMTFWATPGGGVEPGETLLAAAQRELMEELGIAVELEGPVHTAVGIFEFEGELIENTDNFFAGRWDGAPHLLGATETESAALVEARWWTIQELESTREDFFPRDLAAVVKRLS